MVPASAGVAAPPTVLVPRRTYTDALGRLLHRGTGEKMAKTPEQQRHVAVTIPPFDASHAMRALESARVPDMG